MTAVGVGPVSVIGIEGVQEVSSNIDATTKMTSLHVVRFMSRSNLPVKQEIACHRHAAQLSRRWGATPRNDSIAFFMARLSVV
jgi:hypothetical protein